MCIHIHMWCLRHVQLITDSDAGKFCTVCSVSAMGSMYTVEPPNKGHFGNRSFVLSSEVVPISEVHHIIIISTMFKLL